MSFASIDAIVAEALQAWRPPPRLSLSQWADEHFVLSPEMAAEPGRWKTLPYQRGIMDAITDPAVEEVSIQKSARIGYTLMLLAAMGYFIDHDPSSMLVVQPTVDDAKNFSKESVAPMLRDVPVLSQKAFRDLEEKGPKDASATLLHKAFPGGILSLIGANSGTGFRRVSRRVVMFDEVDAYPPSAGTEGDQIKLGKKRAETFWNRKIIAGSTPLIAGGSRIAERFEEGDQRRYYVPCPHCGHQDFLTFSEQTGEDARGHWMAFDSSSPEAAFASAHFICRGCGCEIGHEHKRSMVERGEWRADKPFRGHASFHVWAAYSYSPGATWGHIAKEFVEAKKGGPEKLRTFVNTTLGETWTEKGEAPEWRRLFERREDFDAVVPEGVAFLTAGVDVQADRLIVEVVAWRDDFQSWTIETDIIVGDTAKQEVWAKLSEFLTRTWPSSGGLEYRIAVLAVDSGFNTQTVYNWARKYPGRVIACKGSATAKTLLGQPTPVDVKFDGKRIARGCKVWPVGVDIAKAEFYGWLRLDAPTKPGEPFPLGYCHFSKRCDEEYFRQITAEQRVKHVRRGGFVTLEWAVIPGRQNHLLDCRVYARAAANRCGLDRLAAQRQAREAAGAEAGATAAHGTDAPAAPPPPPPTVPADEARRTGAAPDRSGSWLYGGRERGRW